MNLSLSTPNGLLTLDLPGKKPAPTRLDVHPDNLGELDPLFRANQYEEFGVHHNGSIAHAFEVCRQPYREKDIHLAIRDYFSGIRMTMEPENNHLRRTPYDTIFWPTLPDWFLEIGFRKVISEVNNYDPRTTSYREFKDRVVSYEEQVIAAQRRVAGPIVKTILGACSIIRHSTALWTTHFIQQAQVAAPGEVDEILALCNPVIRADKRAFRASRNWNLSNEATAQNVSDSSSSAALGVAGSPPL